MRTIPAHIRDQFPPAAIIAFERFERRQCGHERPSGAQDAGGRWYPDADERQECCTHIRPPSRAWPGSLYAHCCTLGHCGRLEGLHRQSHRVLRRLAFFVADDDRPARTAPHDLCLTCGASWLCEHRQYAGDVHSLWEDPELIEVASFRADFGKHLQHAP